MLEMESVAQTISVECVTDKVSVPTSNSPRRLVMGLVDAEEVGSVIASAMNKYQGKELGSLAGR